MVIGRSSRTVVPVPTRLASETRPPICSITVRTTSMPMPRPEISETSAAVENPGAKTRSITRSSVSAVSSSAGTNPFSEAFRRTTAGSMPRPSSLTSIRNLSPIRDASIDIVAVSGFPAVRRCVGTFDTVIHCVAHQMHQRFEQAIDDGLVGFGGFT